MISRLCSAIVGLLVFAGMILAGLAAGNPFVTVVERALVGLVGGMVVGYIAGCISEHIVKEHFSDIIQAEAKAEAERNPPPAVELTDAAGEVTEVGRDDSENKEDGQTNREYLNGAQARTLAARAAEVMLGETHRPSRRAEV